MGTDDLLKTFVEFLPDATAAVSAEGIIEAANEPFASGFGMQPRDLIGKSIIEYISDPDASVREYLTACGGTRQPLPGALTVRGDHGQGLRRRCVGWVLQPAAGGRSPTIALRFPSKDASLAEASLTQTIAELTAEIRRRRHAEAQLEALAAAKEEAYRELDQFAYVASHDLRAPLRGIANLAQWIQDDLGEQLSGETAEHLRLLQGRVRRMEALIDGVLAYSRAGRQLGPPEPVDTGELVREIIELLAPPEGVVIDVPHEMPVVESERIPLQQVFMNLIGNGLKYGGAMRPDVCVRVDCREAGGFYEFSVSDNGPGIAPEYHERIWGIFQTLEARDKVEGTGIGLSVVKKLVETRGGRVSLESAPGEGATFRFTWRKTCPEGAFA